MVFGAVVLFITSGLVVLKLGLARREAVLSYVVGDYEREQISKARLLWSTDTRPLNSGRIFANQPPLSKDRLISLFSLGDRPSTGKNAKPIGPTLGNVKTSTRGTKVADILIQEATRAFTERRKYGRLPLLQPVLVQDSNAETYSAFTRDISKNGIGVLHGFELEVGDVVTIVTRSQDDGVLEMRVRVRWCISTGHGWYMSGGIFD